MKKEISIINVYNHVPSIPVDPKQLSPFITIEKKAIEAMKLLIKRPNLPPEIYNQALKTAQNHAEVLLKAELRLADILRGITVRQGKRTDLDLKKLRDSNNPKSKKETIKLEYGLTIPQAKAISRLNQYGVDEAIKLAKEKKEIPTRALALSLVKEKKRKENNKEYRPTGIYSDDKATKLSHFMRLLNPIKCGSAFSNVGFDEYYLYENGFLNLIGSELLPLRAKWYREIYPHSTMIEGDINKKKDEYIKLSKQLNLECGIFTPACQTFTVAGKRDFSDPRTLLFVTMLEIIEQVEYKYVLIENVREYLSASPKAIQHILKGKTIVEYIKETLEKLGYWVNIDVINAAHYSNATSRKRCIILAAKTGLWRFPKKDKFQMTVWDAIGHLPSLEPGEDSGIMYHKDDSNLTEDEIEFLRHTPTGKSAWDNAPKYQPVTKKGKRSGAKHKASFSREDKNKASTTMTSDNYGINGHNCVHPGTPLTDGTWSDPRPYTTLEKLLINGINPNYKIPNWASNHLICEVLGEIFLPKLCLRLLQNIPETKLLTYNPSK